MISFRQKGDFSKTLNFLKNAKNYTQTMDLDSYAKQGVNALSSATPVDTGLTARSWYYEIKKTKDTITINFNNSNIQNGVLIAIILQYGHGTSTGGYVQGRDYINPAIQPIFDAIAENAWKEVNRL